MGLLKNTGIVSTSIYPKAPGERVNFEIVLPFDCLEVYAVRAVAVPSPFAMINFVFSNWPHNSAGQLGMAWAAPGDVFFQTNVELARSFEMDYSPMNLDTVSGISGANYLGMNGGKLEPTPLKVSGQIRKLSCFYRDHINEIANAANGYSVQVFVYYHKRP